MSTHAMSTDFPELGSAPRPAANVAPVWLARTPETSAPASGTNTPAPEASTAPSLSIPGQYKEYLILQPDDILPREQLKRPLPDIIKDFNRRSRAQIRIAPHADNMLRIEATGPKGDSTTQSLKDFVGLIGAKLKLELDVQRWARPHIIGKGGATIKALQEKTGARIHVPKEDGQAPAEGEDDDQLIRVVVEGNTQQAAHARNLIFEIMGDRAGTVTLAMKEIPAEFYPFIAGDAKSLEQESGIQIRVPAAQPFSSTPPTAQASGRPDFFAATDSFIQLRGDRYAAKAVRAKIEERVQELRDQLAVEPVHIQPGRHQFIIGDKGISMEQFFEETGCTIVMPSDEDEDMVQVIGPSHQTAAGVQKTVSLAMDMQCSNIDISRFHRQAPGGAAVHARNVTRYLQQKRELERVGNLHNVQFNTPFSEQGALPWEIYSRDGANIVRAQAEIKAMVDAHPPARMATAAVDPFYHQYIRKEVAPHVRQNFGVHLVVPEASEPNAPILLVYESSSSPDAYQVARDQPKQQDIKDMQKGLQDAQRHILDLMNEREAVSSKTIEVPVQ
jgi:rRNA processing protein Krr1/Pno1